MVFRQRKEKKKNHTSVKSEVLAPSVSNLPMQLGEGVNLSCMAAITLEEKHANLNV